MGIVAKILSFTRNPTGGINKSDVKINPDGGSNITAQHFSSPGDDSVPLPTDFVATTDVQGSGREAAVGYADSLNTPKSLEGDKRIYSRDASGAEKADVWLKNDGTILIENALGNIEVKPAGDIVATNPGGSIELKPDGTLNIIESTAINLTAPIINLIGNVVVTGTIAATSIATVGDVVANGKSLETHIHTAGTPPGNTGPPV